jgi:hypothetical protein
MKALLTEPRVVVKLQSWETWKSCDGYTRLGVRETKRRAEPPLEMDI